VSARREDRGNHTPLRRGEDMAKATWRRVGADSWAGSTAAACIRGEIFVVNGQVLYALNVAAGTYRRASEEAWSTRFMVSDGRSLYTIEEDGGLYRVNPADAASERIGGDDWSSTRALAALDGKLWTADERGIFYSIDPTVGRWEEPKTAYPATETRFVAGVEGMIYALRADGEIMSVLWRDGSAGSLTTQPFPGARGLVASRGRLYVPYDDGHVYAVPLLAKGQYASAWSALDTGTSWDTQLAWASPDRIYTIEADGGIYEITPE
jgi:outer membrane protein assembly factor BamB